MAFWQLIVPTSPEASDGLTNFLWEQGALGVVEEESPGEPAQLRAFFPEAASSTGLLRAVRGYRASLAALGFAIAGEPDIAPLHDSEWASAWQQSFPPRAIGDRLLIAPPWEVRSDASSGDRIHVIIEPGRAFGTGHHGSTEGCLVLLEAALRRVDTPPSRLLDIGTGSGILAIAALKLGVPRGLGIDFDPDAIVAARHNAARNDCADRIALELARPEDVSAAPPFPLVLANLLTHTHVALGSHYARLTAPGGCLVLGGILADEADVVREAMDAAGLSERAQVVVDGWSSLRFASPVVR
jgi:ribosomal protein L11 methyltransferase